MLGSIRVSNSHTKFGWNLPNGLGGDSITDRRTDGGNYISPSLFKKRVGVNIINFFKSMGICDGAPLTAHSSNRVYGHDVKGP